MKNLLSYLFVVLTVALLLGTISCVKQEFDEPPAADIPVGDVYTIAQLRQMYADSSEYTFTGDFSVYATVTMDESTGNIYRTAYIQDNTDATYLFMKTSGGVAEGDSVRLYLDGCTLSSYGGVFQIINVDNDSSIVIIDNGKNLEPEVITMAMLSTGNYESKLVTLTDVQFASSELGKTWAESSDYGNRTLEDCDENTAIVRTSSYSSFAEEILPEGNGDITGIVSRYNETMQFYVRSMAEVNLTGERCGNGGGGGSQVDPVETISEDFSGGTDYEDIEIEGWTNIMVQGSRRWQTKSFNSDKYAQATAYNSGLDVMETWLITPPIINTSGDKILVFESAQAYWLHTGTPMQVLASTDFTGDNFATATWTEIDVRLATSSDPEHSWISSGDVALSAFTGNVTIAFKYIGSDTESTSMRIDNLTIDTEGSGGGGGGVQVDPVDVLTQDFETFADYDDIILDGWLNVAEAGSRTYIARAFDSNIYAQASAYNAGDDSNISWLVTAPLNLLGQVFNFRSKDGYDNGATLEVLISSDYDGEGSPWNATWTNLNPAISSGNTSGYAATWTESGDIILPDAGVGYIAFKYIGDSQHTTTFQIDDVNVAIQ